ncbi:uncharacterized protein I303_106949 [Kwoniella dejecticola CBS 10117]|uniref:Uncharacterized protein n=1 Tax=Kwoniella dejecticola CBS 10117 TaxID=1296121 RepID=A0AAJ8MJT9_9TREE
MSQPCEGCNCGRAEQAQVPTAGIGPRQLRSFTSPADSDPNSAEGIEPAVPLRSKKWFNDPSDLGES